MKVDIGVAADVILPARAADLDMDGVRFAPVDEVMAVGEPGHWTDGHAPDRRNAACG